MKLVIAVDCDGTLCEEVCWTVQECENATPKQNIIDLINEHADKHYVIVHTARTDDLIPATLKWLRKHGVKFQAISNNKLAADIYIDDLSFRPHEHEKIGEKLNGIEEIEIWSGCR